MAKKIRVEDYEKNQKIESKQKKTDIVKIISLIGNGLLIISLIVLTDMHLKSYSQEEYESMLDEKNSEIEDLKYDLDRVLKDKDREYIEEKLDFMDENVVFWIEGYGNYYYTYDCMMKKVGYKSYSYRAMTDVAAKAEGLKKGSCK